MKNMKPWKLLPRLKFMKKLSQKGQSIVEFVLLLLAITLISYGFVAQMNQFLAKMWEYSATLVVNDKPTKVGTDKDLQL